MTTISLNARLGDAIRQRRILRGMSQKDLGEHVGVTFQ
jgi:transcriptional regulator with XRE-family HTH domain